MITTRHNITLEIDGIPLSLVAKRMSKDEEKSFDELVKRGQEKAKANDDLKAEIESLSEQYTMAKELASASGIVDKVKYLLEARSLLSRIDELKRQVNPNINKELEDDLEAMAASVLKMSLSGDVDRLFELINQKNLSYQEVQRAINAEVSKALTKK